MVLNFGDYFCVGKEKSRQEISLSNAMLHIGQSSYYFVSVYPISAKMFLTYEWEKEFKSRKYLFQGSDLGMHNEAITQQDGEFERHTLTKFEINISYFKNGILFHLEIWSSGGDYICYGANIEEKNKLKPLNEKINVFVPLDKMDAFFRDEKSYICDTKKALEKSKLQAYKV